MLKAILTSEQFGELTDDIKSHYKKIGDGDSATYRLDVEAVDGFSLAETSNLQKALQSEREARKKAESAFKPFENMDPAQAKEALEKMDEIANWDPDQKLAEAKTAYEKQLRDKWEGTNAKLKEKHATEMVAAEKQTKTLEEQVTNLLITSEATKAISEAKGSVPLLLPIVRDKVRIVANEETGQRSVEVIGSDGLARLSPSKGNDEKMSIAELITELQSSDEFGRAFGGSGSSGSGGPGGSGSSGSAFKLTEQQAQDHELYKRTREAAEKAGQSVEIV